MQGERKKLFRKRFPPFPLHPLSTFKKLSKIINKEAKMRKIRVLCFLCVLCLFLSFWGCDISEQTLEKTYFEYFDTVSVIYSYADESEENFESNCRKIESVFEKYHRLFDIYNEYEGINNLCTLNKNAGGDAISLDRELMDFLLYAKELFDATKGEMNVMMGAVLSLWHDCRENGAPIPEKNALEAAARHTSIELLEIDVENGRARITDPEASIDVGALGKGYAAEMAAWALKRSGVYSYVLDVGGNLRIVGAKPDGNGWITGIKDPHNASQYAEKLTLSDISCVTSGDYERYFEVDGIRYHHIIDKDTLYPAEYFSSVTVICRDSGLADALSTALFCMSYEEGRALVDALDSVEVIWVTKAGGKYTTDGIDRMRSRE